MCMTVVACVYPCGAPAWSDERGEKVLNPLEWELLTVDCLHVDEGTALGPLQRSKCS